MYWLNAKVKKKDRRTSSTEISYSHKLLPIPVNKTTEMLIEHYDPSSTDANGKRPTNADKLMNPLTV